MSDNITQTQQPVPAASVESKRPYTAPRILSAEPLEAMAATCSPQSGSYGKSIPVPCGVRGS
jgi:hypothetical protein